MAVWDLKPCGTLAAYRRHLRRGEPPCYPCKTANIAKNTNPGRASELLFDPRPRRNGIPWRPYIYRGTGYDQCEETSRW